MPKTTGLGIFAGVNDAIVATMGEPFRHIPAVGPPVDLTGIFDARHFEVDVGGEVGVSEYQTHLSCRRDDVEFIATGDLIEVRGAGYRVRDIRPDSEGMVVLALEQEV